MDNKNKKELFQQINIVFCTLTAILVMFFIGKSWSENGPYTLLSFFSSLIFHGCPFIIIAYYINKKIEKYFKK